MSTPIRNPNAIHVIDDFLDNPQAVRSAALTLSFPPANEEAYFPGRNSTDRLAIPDLDHRLSQLAGATLTPTPRTVHGHARISIAGDTGRGGVHVDQSHWSGVLYLSDPGEADSGTDFYRHRASGMTRAPLTREELALYGVESFGKMWSEVITPHTHDMTKWELVRRVQMKFNRLLFFRPWIWHAAGPGFGSTLQDGRLIVVIAMNELQRSSLA